MQALHAAPAAGDRGLVCDSIAGGTSLLCEEMIPAGPLFLHHRGIQSIPLFYDECHPGFTSCCKIHTGAWEIELHLPCRLSFTDLKMFLFAKSGASLHLQDLLRVLETVQLFLSQMVY